MNQELIDLTNNSLKDNVSIPKLGFLGVGWIGRNRMEGIHRSGFAQVNAVADINASLLEEAAMTIAGVKKYSSLEDLIKTDIDGIVIATPSALHASQSIEALNSGKAVFCQKPLGRDYEETKAVVDAAKLNDRLLGVDFSYRFLRSSSIMKEIVRSGELGDIFSTNLVFHNAYGPDKQWFYDVQKSGGGCLVDLGVHLIDLALWTLDFPKADKVMGSVYSGGEKLPQNPDIVEDFAAAQITFSNGTEASLSCSWRLHAGRDAVIEASFYGTKGGISLRNVNGSFYDFELLKYKGTSSETLDTPPDEWGSRAAVDWAANLSAGKKYNPEIEGVVTVAEVIDRIYGR